MNYNKLEKATAVLTKIKAIDAEIIELDKFAMMIANGEIKSSFDLKLKDLKKSEETEKKKVLSEDGSLNTGEEVNGFKFYMPSMFSSLGDKEEKKDPNTHTLSHDLSDTAVLQIMGVMLCEKHDRRNNLIRQLQSYGVVA